MCFGGSGFEVCTCGFENYYYHLRIVPKQLRKTVHLNVEF